MRVETWQGDITTLDVDAVVNAANEHLARGSGVCGAIFAAAGPELDVACAAIGHCDTGDAVVTPGFALASRWVIHAVGPIHGDDPQRDADRLASAYRRALDAAVEVGARSIAFPAISTGVYGYPAEAAAEVAVATLTGLDRLDLDLVLVAFDRRTAAVYERLLA